MVDLIESQTMELSRRSLLLSAWFFRDEQNSTFSSEVKVVTLFAVRNAAGQYRIYPGKIFLWRKTVAPKTFDILRENRICR
jgi:hypothetical protein